MPGTPLALLRGVSRQGLQRVRAAADQFARAAEQAAVAGENRQAARLYKAALVVLLSGPSEEVGPEAIGSEETAALERA